LGGWLSFLGGLALAAYVPGDRLGSALFGFVFVGFRAYSAIEAWRSARRDALPGLALYPRAWSQLIVVLGVILLDRGIHLGVSRVWLAAYRVHSSSMEDTLLPGDSVVVDRSWYLWHSIRRGEVVMVETRLPDRSSGASRGSRSSRIDAYRVIGIPGDRVYLRGGTLKISGRLMQEPYAKQKQTEDSMRSIEFAESVPEGSVFVIEDNRTGEPRRPVGRLVRAAAVVGRLQVVVSHRELDRDSRAGGEPREIGFLERIGLRVRHTPPLPREAGDPE